VIVRGRLRLAKWEVTPRNKGPDGNRTGSRCCGFGAVRGIQPHFKHNRQRAATNWLSILSQSVKEYTNHALSCREKAKIGCYDRHESYRPLTERRGARARALTSMEPPAHPAHTGVRMQVTCVLQFSWTSHHFASIDSMEVGQYASHADCCHGVR
jgi:hypothetical protein